jgi:hypothetical protein
VTTTNLTRLRAPAAPPLRRTSIATQVAINGERARCRHHNGWCHGFASCRTSSFMATRIGHHRHRQLEIRRQLAAIGTQACRPFSTRSVGNRVRA